ncbi:MAG: flavin reductase [Alphaproteobacteria bacterium]|nr:flavin reductase [Alphaproteobacteria bacterium]
MDTKAFFKLTYGLYVIGVKNGDKFGGCIVDAVMQATVQPPVLIIACNQCTKTNECLQETKELTLSVVSETTDPFIIGNFGFQSCRSADKWEKVPHHFMKGLPVLDGAAAYLHCRVTETKQLSTHTLFFCEVTEAIDGESKALSYTEYQETWKPKVMEAFQSGQCTLTNEKGEKKMTKWVCKVCGYVYEGEELPEDYVCPVCGVGPEEFEKAEEKAETKPAEAKYVCSVCGYVYDGDVPFEDLPEDYVCPICQQPKSVFVKE